MSGMLTRLEHMLNASNVGVWHLHVPTSRVTRNRVFVGMTHIPADELASGLAVWSSRIHAADREEVLSKRRQLLAGELDSYWVDYRVRRTGGGWVSLRAHVAVIERSSAGQPVWVGGILFDVSREKEVERRMHAVFDRPFQFIGLLTPEGVVVETNRSSLLQSGHQAGEVLGKLFWEGPLFANSPELQQRMRDGVARAAAGEMVRFEMVNRAADGPDVTVDFTLTPLRDDDGDIVNVIPEGRNISDLAQTREMLREMEGRLTTATQAANIGLWKWELKTDEVWFSDQWYRMSWLQRGAAPTTRRTWIDLVHPADRRRVKFELDKHASGEFAEYRMQFRMRRPDNSQGWFYRSHARSRRRRDGKVSQVAGVLMDITDQHSIEERLAVATASANIGLWDMQYPEGPVWFSDQWWSMLGYGPTDVPTSMASFLSLIHPDDRAHTVSAMRKHRDGVNLDLDIELRMRCKDGSWRWIHSKGRAVERALDGAPARVSGVHIDITEHKEAESRLTAAERLESIGRLAAGVAHEINTPVQYVNDSIYFVREGVKELLAHMNELQTRLGAAPVMTPELLYLQEHLPSALDRTVDGLARIAEIVRSMKEFSYADQERHEPRGPESVHTEHAGRRDQRVQVRRKHRNRPGRLTASHLPRQPDQPGGAEPGGERGSCDCRRGERDRRQGAHHRQDLRRRRGSCHLQSPTPAAASRSRFVTAYSSRSSPPRRWARAPARGWRSPVTWSHGVTADP